MIKRTMIQVDESTLRSIIGDLVIDELKAIHELVADIPIMKQDIAVLKADVAVLKSDMAAVKVLLRQHSGQLDSHETRLARIEAKPT